MDNYNIQNLLKQLESCTLSEIKELQQDQTKIVAQRTVEFLKAVENSDLSKIQKLVELEVDFSNPELWKTLARTTNLSNTSSEVLDYFMALNLKAKPIDSNEIYKYC